MGETKRDWVTAGEFREMLARGEGPDFGREMFALCATIAGSPFCDALCELLDTGAREQTDPAKQQAFTNIAGVLRLYHDVGKGCVGGVPPQISMAQVRTATTTRKVYDA